MHIKGHVETGFESVKKLFEHEMNTMAEESAQLCVYHKGKMVVDLWASKKDTFTADTLVNIFSSGKTLETLALAHLVDQGLLDYNESISKYWPEFSENNKAHVTVADLMRHEAGLVDFNYTFDPEHLLPDNLKQNTAGSVIEKLPARISSNPNMKRNYHALTRGWVVNEIFRRVEPNGRTLGQYIREDIAQPLNVDVYVGLKDDELNRRAPVKTPPITFQFFESFKPKFLGRKFSYSIGHLIALLTPVVLRVITAILKNRKKKKSSTSSSKEKNLTTQRNERKQRLPFKGFNPLLDREKSIDFFNLSVIAQGESSSFNANCSARGLAKLAATMAGGGTFEGKQYFSKASWQQLHDKPLTAKLGGNVITHFTQGGLNLFKMDDVHHSTSDKALNQGREGFYGWMGLGGSIFQWHPEKEIGFAFVPTSLHIIDLFNERGKVYQEEVIKCINKL